MKEYVWILNNEKRFDTLRDLMKDAYKLTGLINAPISYKDLASGITYDAKECTLATLVQMSMTTMKLTLELYLSGDNADARNLIQIKLCKLFFKEVEEKNYNYALATAVRAIDFTPLPYKIYDTFEITFKTFYHIPRNTITL